MRKIYFAISGVSILLASLSSCNSGSNLGQNKQSLPAADRGAANLIQNGQLVTDPQLNARVPLLLIGKTTESSYGICSATLVANDTVLTAAHCVLKMSNKPAQEIYSPKNLYAPAELQIILSKDLSKPVDITLGIDKNKYNIYNVAKIYAHHDAFKGANVSWSGFVINEESQLNDLAILKLSQVVANHYASAKLATNNPTVDTPEIIAGYGVNVGPGIINRADTDIGAAGVLRAATSQVANLDSVGSYISVGGLSQTKIKSYTKICQGDSGGPDFILGIDNSYTITGVHSFGDGKNCGGKNTPAWSVSVAYYHKWLNGGYLNYHI